MPRRRRRYHGPHPYVRIGRLGASLGCSGCLVVVHGVIVLAVLAAIAA